jgi:tetratricopeptide (TPR) repeat protein
LFNQGKLSQAIDAYAQVVHSRPKDSASYIAMARAQVWAGKYLNAQESAENAILLNPSNSTAHAVRAWALDFQGDYLAAEVSIKRALELDPDNPLAHAYYAELLIDQNQNNTGPLDAIEMAGVESKKALELAVGPAQLEAHRARGYVYSAIQKYDLAVAEYQAAIAINKNIEDLQLNLGLSYRALEANAEAIDAFSKANTLNPADPLPNFYISRVDAGIGEYGRALQYAEQAMKASPTETNYHGNLGVMYYRNFKYKEAANELALVVNGGTMEDGTAVTAMALVNSPRVAEYYFIYAVTLTKLKPPRCGDALQVAQQILDKLRDDETSVFNANEVIRLCTETTPVPGADGSETPGTPSNQQTPTVSPTP